MAEEDDAVAEVLCADGAQRNGEPLVGAVLPHGQGDGRAVRSAPRCPKLPIVGPDLQSFVASAENGEATICPIGLLISVLDEPIEHLKPKVTFVSNWKWLRAQIMQEGAKPLTLFLVRQVKARFRQDGIAYEEVIGRQ